MHDAYPVSAYELPEDKVEAALAYPGERPAGSFVTDGETVTLLPDNFEDFRQQTDAILTARGLPVLCERIPVLAYGANANPSKIIVKMAKFDPEKTDAMQVVPHCVAVLVDTAAVWHGRPGQNGSYFAELYAGPEVEGTELQAHVAFLTIHQLGALDASEGKTYTRIEMPIKLGLDAFDAPTMAIAYAALESQILLDNDQRPVLVTGLKHTDSKLQTMTSEEALRYTLDTAILDTEAPVTAYDYVKAGLGMKLSAKKQRQAAIQEIMIAKGISRSFSAVDAEPNKAIGRVDFASLPGQDRHVHQIPEMVWSKEMALANSKRAFEELAVRTGLDIA